MWFSRTLLNCPNNYRDRAVSTNPTVLRSKSRYLYRVGLEPKIIIVITSLPPSPQGSLRVHYHPYTPHSHPITAVSSALTHMNAADRTVPVMLKCPSRDMLTHNDLRRSLLRKREEQIAQRHERAPAPLLLSTRLRDAVALIR